MPSKIQLDENLWFLFICLTKSDFKTIDFNAVGESTNLNPPAARMRYTRLRRQIESGTLIGTHGTPFQGGAEKIAEAQRKRRRNSPAAATASKTAGTLTDQVKKEKSAKLSRKSEGEESSEEDVPLMKRFKRRISKGTESTKSVKTESEDLVVKKEEEEEDDDTGVEKIRRTELEDDRRLEEAKVSEVPARNTDSIKLEGSSATQAAQNLLPSSSKEIVAGIEYESEGAPKVKDETEESAIHEGPHVIPAIKIQAPDQNESKAQVAGDDGEEKTGPTNSRTNEIKIEEKDGRDSLISLDHNQIDPDAC